MKDEQHFVVAEDEQVDCQSPHSKKQPEPLSQLTVATIFGGVGALIGNFATDLWLTSKLYNFDSKVAEKTRADILSRNGLGAAGAEGNFGGLAAGISSKEIEKANQYIVANSSEEFSFAKKMLKIGGRGTVTTIAAIGTAVVAALAYLSLAPRRSSENTSIAEQSTAQSRTAHMPHGHTNNHRTNWQEKLANKQVAANSPEHNGHGV